MVNVSKVNANVIKIIKEVNVNYPYVKMNAHKMEFVKKNLIFFQAIVVNVIKDLKAQIAVKKHHHPNVRTIVAIMGNVLRKQICFLAIFANVTMVIKDLIVVLNCAKTIVIIEGTVYKGNANVIKVLKEMIVVKNQLQFVQEIVTIKENV